MNDLSRQTGISPTTVSKFFNNDRKVTKETSKKILNAIESSLATFFKDPKKTKNIGIFIDKRLDDESTITISKLDLSHLLNGICSELFAHDYNVYISPLQNFPKIKKDALILSYKQNYSALLFINPSKKDRHVLLLSKIIPTVIIGSEICSSQALNFCFDNTNSAYNAMSYLLDMGHKDILFISKDISHPDSIELLNGFNRSLVTNGFKRLSVNKIKEFNVKEHEEIQEYINKMFSNKNTRPTAVILHGNYMLFYITSALEMIGLSVPKDLSLIVLDDLDIFENFFTPLTTVRQPFYELGREASFVLVDIINGKSDSWGGKYLLLPQLKIRRSVIKAQD